jgi:hypothetical protein
MTVTATTAAAAATIVAVTEAATGRVGATAPGAAATPVTVSAGGAPGAARTHRPLCGGGRASPLSGMCCLLGACQRPCPGLWASGPCRPRCLAWVAYQLVSSAGVRSGARTRRGGGGGGAGARAQQAPLKAPVRRTPSSHGSSIPLWDAAAACAAPVPPRPAASSRAHAQKAGRLAQDPRCGECPSCAERQPCEGVLPAWRSHSWGPWPHRCLAHAPSALWRLGTTAASRTNSFAAVEAARSRAARCLRLRVRSNACAVFAAQSLCRP